MTIHDTPTTVDDHERRVEEWARHMLHGWPHDETPLDDAMRAAARRAIHHAESEWRASHRPGSLAFTGMPHPMFDGPPATRLLDATSTTGEIRSTLEAMGVGERGILVALAAEILAVDAATNYPQRWVASVGDHVWPVEPIPFVPVADEPVGERVRWPLDEGDTGEALWSGAPASSPLPRDKDDRSADITVSRHQGDPRNCPHPQCRAARS